MSSPRPKLLYITIHTPSDYTSGGGQRSSMILEALLKKYDIDIIAHHDPLPDNIQLPDNCRVIFADRVPHNRRYGWRYTFSVQKVRAKDEQMAQMFERITAENNYDIIFVRYMAALTIFGIEPSPKVYVDVDDLPSQSLWTSIRLEKKWSRKLNTLLKSVVASVYERRVLPRLGRCYFANPAHAHYKNAVVLPNIPALNNLPPAPKEESKDSRTHFHILFIGLMNHMPNIMGVDWFIKNVWKGFVDKYPDALFDVVGGGLGKSYCPELDKSCQERWSNTKGVVLHGFVKDLEPMYAVADVVVAPLFMGSGTNIKVLEAMAYGKVCVASKFAVKGFDGLHNGEQILIAKSARDFVSKLSLAVENAQLRRHIGAQAQEYIKRGYSREKFETTLLDSLP